MQTFPAPAFHRIHYLAAKDTDIILSQCWFLPDISASFTIKLKKIQICSKYSVSAMYIQLTSSPDEIFP